jgi:hypothetical protein
MAVEPHLHSEPPPPPWPKVPVPDAPRDTHIDAEAGPSQGGIVDIAAGGQLDGNAPPPPLPHRATSHMPTAQSHPQGGDGVQRAALVSWRSVPAPSSVRSRGEALSAVNAMFEFLPAQDTPTYEDWQVRINALLEYARQCLEPARSCSQSHLGPTVGPANDPTQPALEPALQALVHPAAKEPEHVSIGSSASQPPWDAHEIINDRQAKEAHVRAGGNYHGGIYLQEVLWVRGPIVLHEHVGVELGGLCHQM